MHEDRLGADMNDFAAYIRERGVNCAPRYVVKPAFECMVIRDRVTVGDSKWPWEGGHMAGPEVVDLLFENGEFHEFVSPRIEGRNTHGTGCTLSAAIAAYLAQGLAPLEACRSAKTYLTGALRNAVKLGHGHGPVNHFWNVNT